MMLQLSKYKREINLVASFFETICLSEALEELRFCSPFNLKSLNATHTVAVFRLLHLF